MGQFSDLESVQRHTAMAMNYVVAEVAESMRLSVSEADQTKSPIEAIFFIWWQAMQIGEFGRGDGLELSSQHEYTCRNGRKYVLDFHITPYDTDMWLEGHTCGMEFKRIGVEMDGHDFHERTKDQVALRNERDRDLLADGWHLLHYSGSELYRDPRRVVAEVFDVGRRYLNDFLRELRAKKRARGDYGK